MNLRSNMKVLVCEDDKAMGFIIANYLGDYGYNFAIENNIGSAVNRAATFLPDAIITDYYLGAGTGVDLVEKLNSLFNRKIPFIIITSIDLEYLMEYENFPSRSAYLQKPFTLESLKTKIESLHEHNS